MLNFIFIETKRGRPSIFFEESSDRTKSNLVRKIRENYHPDLIAKAFEMNIKYNGTDSQT